MFAENNSTLNYLKIAILSALCVKNNMGKDTKVSVITNSSSLGWFSDEEKAYIYKLFDKVILKDDWEKEYSAIGADNTRIFRDTQYYHVSSRFLNKSRSSAYELSPYDETLLIDADYFVMNSSLNAVWGCNEDFLINKNAKTLDHKILTGPEFRLNPFGIRMYWATVIYFKKSEKAKLIFNLVDHIKEAWHYYKHVYDFSGTLYRNDFAFSIAIHMLNGFVDDEEFVKSLPDPAILTAVDTDQFIGFVDKTTTKFYLNDTVASYKFYVSKIKGVNVHSLNKLSILNKFDESLEILK